MVYPAEMLLIAVSKSIGAFCVPAAVDFPDGDTYKSHFVCSGSDGEIGREFSQEIGLNLFKF